MEGRVYKQRRGQRKRETKRGGHHEENQPKLSACENAIKKSVILHTNSTSVF